MAHGLTIGQVARTSGVAAKTIRYYEQIGVLPAPSRAASSYRLYDQRGVERLRFVRRARSLGLPLRQLRTLVCTVDGGLEPARRASPTGTDPGAAPRREQPVDRAGAAPTPARARFARDAGEPRTYQRCLPVSGDERPGAPART